jgi:hypothetical protein
VSAPSTIGASDPEVRIEPIHAVAGIDPHKNTATIAIIDLQGGRRGHSSFAVTPDGVIEMLEFLTDEEVVIDRIGVEGSGGLGHAVVVALVAAGYDIQHRVSVRSMVRNRAGRLVLRRGRRATEQAPTGSGRQPQCELRPAYHPCHPGPLSPSSQAIHRSPSR